MKFETHILPKPLNTYIESIFHFKGFIPEHSIERVVPTGHIFIIFELDGIQRNTFNNDTLEPNGMFSEVWVSGMHKNYLSISAHHNSEMLVIQFKPSGAFPFFQQPIHLLNNTVKAATCWFGKEIVELRQKILKQSTSVAKFKIVDHWLLKKMNMTETAGKEILNVIHLLQKEPLTQHQEIINSYPKTQKHLISQFKKYVGLTPKVLHRIFRFNEILHRIHLKEKIAWPQIAYQFGYSDQSHFIKEFKEFSGFNPQEFINFDFHKGEPNFFPLDKKG